VSRGDHDDDVFDWFPGGHLARVLVAESADDDDAPFELFAVTECEAGWPTKFYRDEVPRMKRAPPAFPKLIDHSDVADDACWARFAYVPRVPFRDLLDDDEPAGIALPMAVSLASSLASSLLELDDPHGSVGLDCCAVSVDGAARIDWRPRIELPMSARTRVGQVYMNNHDTMPAELVRGDPATLMGDVFSLGAVLFALVVGRSPFARASWMNTLAAIVMEPVPPLEHHAVTPELAAVVARMLDKNAAARPFMHEVPSLLAQAAPWASWTEAQCADELRAMFPAEVERLRATAPPTTST
jgi:hypothetical protein